MQRSPFRVSNSSKLSIAPYGAGHALPVNHKGAAFFFVQDVQTGEVPLTFLRKNSLRVPAVPEIVSLSATALPLLARKAKSRANSGGRRMMARKEDVQPENAWCQNTTTEPHVQSAWP